MLYLERVIQRATIKNESIKLVIKSYLFNKNLLQEYTKKKIMIVRRIQWIDEFPLNKEIAFQIDPHGHFMAIYLSLLNQIKIIKTIALEQSYCDFILRFQHKNKYTDDIQLSSHAVITDKFLFQGYPVNQIVISSLYKYGQLLGATNYISIKIFKITIQRSSQKAINILPFGEVLLNSVSPLLQFSIWYQTIHVAYSNRNYQSYEYKQKKGKHFWVEVGTKLLGTNDFNKESLRLLMYSQQLNYEHKLDVNDLYEDEQTTQQRQQQIEQKQRITKQLYSHKKLIRLSNNELDTDKQTFMLNKFYHKTQMPNGLSIIYINRKNILCKATFNHLDRKYVSKQICSRYQQAVQFKSLQQEQFYWQLRNIYPIRYIKSQHPNYIICLQQNNKIKWHSIRSKNHEWNIIFKDSRYPVINPFYLSLEKHVLQQILLQSNKEFCLKFFKLIQTYEMIFVCFPKDFKLHFQLIVIERRKEENKQIGVQSKRFNMFSLSIDKFNPQLSKFISAYDIVYLTKQYESKRENINHLRICENILIKKLKNIFCYLVFNRITDTNIKFNKVIDYVKKLQMKSKQKKGDTSQIQGYNSQEQGDYQNQIQQSQAHQYNIKSFKKKKDQIKKCF